MNSEEDIYNTFYRTQNKDIFIDLKRNNLGVYLKISERKGDKSRNTVMIPLPGVFQLSEILNGLVQNVIPNINIEQNFYANQYATMMSYYGYDKRSTIYVSGLSPDISNDQLGTFFDEQVGNVVKAYIVFYPHVNGMYSSGTGVVEFENAYHADYAVQHLNGIAFNGHILNIHREKQKKHKHHPSRRNSSTISDNVPNDTNSIGSFSGSNTTDEGVMETTKLFVSNVYEGSEEELQQLFQPFGEVTSISRKSSKSKKPFSSWIVSFTTEEATSLALEKMNGTLVKNYKISVRECSSN